MSDKEYEDIIIDNFAIATTVAEQCEIKGKGNE